MTANLLARHALAIVENSPYPLLIMDNSRRALACNAAFAALVGDAWAAELTGGTGADLADHPARALLGEAASICWTDRHGKPRHFEIVSISFDDEQGLQARLYVDITRQLELEHANGELDEQLRQNVLTDPTTGLLNRRGVMLALEPQVARSRRYNSPISVVMLEALCPQECDSIRLHIARLLKDQLRWADLIGYSDRQEFMLILPETTAEAAVRLADKLARRVQEMVERELDGLTVDTCCGVTGWRRSDSAESLLGRAASALADARSANDRHAIAL